MSDLSLRPGRLDAIEGPLLTVVLDGVGLGPADAGNAVHLAHTPVLDHLYLSLMVRQLVVGRALGILRPVSGWVVVARVGNAIKPVLQAVPNHTVPAW